MKKTTSWMVCAVVLMTAMTVRADILTFTMNNVGSDVVATISGSVNTDALTVHQINYTDSGAVWAAQGVLAVGSEHSLWRWTGFASETSSFGSGVYYKADSSTDDYASVNFLQLSLYLPKDYVSGSALSGTSTWNDVSVDAPLYIVPGTYTMTYNGGADSIVVNVIPEPATALIVALGGGLLALFRRFYSRF